MKFANVQGLRCEAAPGMRGLCPGCDAAVIAKCGIKRIWHWAHLGIRSCDPWWEPETEWHRNWKNGFPTHCQEVRQTAPDGELHIADVRTEAGCVLEFQHSAISLIERASRERFYRPMAWVVDGSRFKRDFPIFQRVVRTLHPLRPLPATWRLAVSASPILERWQGSRYAVYIDFGDWLYEELWPLNEPPLWRLQFEPNSAHVTVTPIRRRSFIGHHVSGAKLEGYAVRVTRTARSHSGRMAHRPLVGFEHYLARKAAKRHRF